ncbi:MAG: HTTM domain-containing protein [Acidimicrobiales bacterium]|nr:HTTM domain-containing protein [Acidimicrobiales bacterium]
MTSLDAALTLSALVAAAGCSISSLEALAGREQYAVGGVFDWRVLRHRSRVTVHGPAAALFDRAFGYPGVLGLFTVQAAASVALAALAFRQERWLPALVVLAAHLVANMRHRFGLDGSDQMISIVLVGIVVGSVVDDASAQNVTIAFVTAQLVLSYVVAGVAKIISPEWRSGRAVLGISETRSYGSERTVRVLRRHRPLAVAMAWATMGFEVAAPLLLLGGPKAALVFLALGACFHLSVAVTMGLNSFVFAFMAAYPLAYVAAERLASL